ncbi:putative PX domain-containing protein kinase-like protein [Apostichopus japonicus]|uniref:Putative PX domain-containing protein kinase-like protein n=1 Tax=Stichopus japonicus TaxID=307972 RepID=A0A2G8K7W2_STIJA|nr:putative PX domain-containing protein kinase-like protein [Apostichopus japonicus]
MCVSGYPCFTLLFLLRGGASTRVHVVQVRAVLGYDRAPQRHGLEDKEMFLYGQAKRSSQSEAGVSMGKLFNLNQSCERVTDLYVRLIESRSAIIWTRFKALTRVTSAFGADKVLDNRDLAPLLKVMPSLQHPFIYPVTFATCQDTGGFVIRTFHGTGTLRDQICKTKPKGQFLKKYCRPKAYVGFDTATIKLYGRQILEALKFLHEKDFPYGHLHAGNVVLEGNACRLLDIENSLLGLPGYYRPYIVQFRKINTMQAVDVYCFGHLLYEMTFGNPLNAASKDDFPHTVPPQIKDVLESILTTEACKTKMPTIDELLENPLFADAPITLGEKPQFRVSSKSKEPLTQATAAVEKRLKDSQKKISSFRRLNKAQAHHNSEEEKKRRKKAVKKRMSEQSMNPNPDSSQPSKPDSNGDNHSTSNGVTSPSSPSPNSSGFCWNILPASGQTEGIGRADNILGAVPPPQVYVVAPMLSDIGFQGVI